MADQVHPAVTVTDTVPVDCAHALVTVRDAGTTENAHAAPEEPLPDNEEPLLATPLDDAILLVGSTPLDDATLLAEDGPLRMEDAEDEPSSDDDGPLPGPLADVPPVDVPDAATDEEVEPAEDAKDVAALVPGSALAEVPALDAALLLPPPPNEPTLDPSAVEVPALDDLLAAVLLPPDAPDEAVEDGPLAPEELPEPLPVPSSTGPETHPVTRTDPSTRRREALVHSHPRNRSRCGIHHPGCVVVSWWIVAGHRHSLPVLPLRRCRALLSTRRLHSRQQSCPVAWPAGTTVSASVRSSSSRGGAVCVSGVFPSSP